MAETVHPVTGDLDRATGQRLFSEDLFLAEWIRAIPASNQSALEKTTNQTVRVIGPASLQSEWVTLV